MRTAEDAEVDVLLWLRVLVRRLPLICSVAVAGVAAALVLGVSATQTYRAQSLIAVTASGAAQGSAERERAVQTVVGLVNDEAFQDGAVRQRPELEVADEISATVVDGTDLLQITARSTTESSAVAAVEAVSAIVIADQQATAAASEDRTAQTYRDLLAQLDQQIAAVGEADDESPVATATLNALAQQRAAVQTQLDTQLLRGDAPASIRVVSTAAVPLKTVTSIARLTALGGVSGVLVGCLVALLVQRRARTLTRPLDIEMALSGRAPVSYINGRMNSETLSHSLLAVARDNGLSATHGNQVVLVDAAGDGDMQDLKCSMQSILHGSLNSVPRVVLPGEDTSDVRDVVVGLVVSKLGVKRSRLLQAVRDAHASAQRIVVAVVDARSRTDA